MRRKTNAPVPREPSLLADVLEAFYEGDVRGAPTQHRHRTSACLTLARIEAALDGAFDSAESSHVPDCAFCQRLAAMAWRVRCPGLAVILAHLGHAPPVRQAIEEHLEADGCRRCRLLTNSRLLGALATRRGGSRSDEGPRAVVGVAADFGLLVAPAAAFAPSPWSSSVRTDGPELDEPGRMPFRLRAVEPGGLVATLRQTDRDTLVVHVHSPEPADAGRLIEVEVAGESGSLSGSVVLAGRGGRCHGRHVFGCLAELRPRLGRCCALVVAFADDRSTERAGS